MSRTTWTLIGGPLLAVVLLAVVLSAVVLGASPGVGLAMPPAGAAGLEQASGAAAATLSVGQVPDARTYRPPVDAPVIDPFRPPAQPWLPGNRGLEYAIPPGTLVRAIGPGVVSFAGPVAGSLHVTVTHPDGLRSSYSFLAAVRTVVGATVAAGDVVGVAAARLHLGVRRGDRYLDPASLWGRRKSHRMV
jgi:murein DD-endopeptidase MepM/ murein hydrolase activator NlpD